MSDPSKKLHLGFAFGVKFPEKSINWVSSLTGIRDLMKLHNLKPEDIWTSPHVEIKIVPAYDTFQKCLARFAADTIRNVMKMPNDISPDEVEAFRKKQWMDAIENGNVTELLGLSALFAASGNVRAIERCHSRSPGILDTRDPAGMSPLAWAAIFGQIKVMEYAFDHGYSPSVTNGYSWTYLDLAARNGQSEMVDFLRKFGLPEPGLQLRREMIEAGCTFK